MLRIFLSYSRADAEFVSKLANDLSDLGFDVLLDKKHLRGGRSTAAEIRTKISQSDYLIPILTGESLRSKWVRPVEISWALRLRNEGSRLRILPILLRESRATCEELEHLNYIDFTDNYSIALARLIQALPDTDYDELANLRRELDEEKIQERSLLNVLKRVATRPRRSSKRPNWQDLSAKQFMREVRKVLRSEELVDVAYWWLIVYGILRFKNIEQFWDEETYSSSVKYAKIAPRGIALMVDLSNEQVEHSAANVVRRRSSRPSKVKKLARPGRIKR